MGRELVTTLRGVDGAETSDSTPPDTFLACRTGVELPLDDRPRPMTFCASRLARRADTRPLAEFPRPSGGGRGRTGEGSEGVFRMEDNEAYWLSLEGEDGLCGGDSVPGLDVPNLGEAILEDDDTTELGRGGGKCGEAANCRSGVPFA